MIDSLFRGERYTTEELNSRLKFFIGIILGLTLFGIVFVVLYSLIFVTQPMNGMSPVDNKFFELIIPIATFLTGTLSGIMLAGDDKDMKMKALEAANKPPAPSSPPPAPVSSGFGGQPLGGGSGSSFPGFGTVPPAVTDFATQAMGSFGVPGFGSPAPASADPGPVMSSSKGKPMPSQPPHPEI